MKQRDTDDVEYIQKKREWDKRDGKAPGPSDQEIKLHEAVKFSISDLVARPNQTSCWDGVRNYQARNMLRDDFVIGDRALFYHSSCKEPAVVGTAFVVREGYPDQHAFDLKHHYFDPKSRAESPTWFMVDVQLESVFSNPVTLACLRSEAAKPETGWTDSRLPFRSSIMSDKTHQGLSLTKNQQRLQEKQIFTATWLSQFCKHSRTAALLRPHRPVKAAVIVC